MSDGWDFAITTLPSPSIRALPSGMIDREDRSPGSAAPKTKDRIEDHEDTERKRKRKREPFGIAGSRSQVFPHTIDRP